MILSNSVKKDIQSSCELSKVIDLPNTGWTILKPGHGWELVFKSGPSCPKHLPPHAHSDLFSFDLFYQGKPLIAEAGTSTYENSKVRLYERSSCAHNTIQLGRKGNFLKNQINWVFRLCLLEPG